MSRIIPFNLIKDAKKEKEAALQSSKSKVIVIMVWTYLVIIIYSSISKYVMLCSFKFSQFALAWGTGKSIYIYIVFFKEIFEYIK